MAISVVRRLAKVLPAWRSGGHPARRQIGADPLRVWAARSMAVVSLSACAFSMAARSLGRFSVKQLDEALMASVRRIRAIWHMFASSAGSIHRIGNPLTRRVRQAAPLKERLRGARTTVLDGNGGESSLLVSGPGLASPARSGLLERVDLIAWREHRPIPGREATPRRSTV